MASLHCCKPEMSNYSLDSYFCSDKGLILPLMNEWTWNKGTRAFLYLLGMLWCFLGVAIVSDSFMCGIEHITSKTRAISVPSSDGTGVNIIEVKVWNDTVANLTLLAFGTSAPEILLSVIETCGHSFVAGELGPGTIVGSAAFNLFVITALCIVTVPDGETRKIRNMLVFAVTSASGVLAYVWLILVLIVITPKVVELWEAIVTCLMFPALILLAYVADKGLCSKKNTISSQAEIGFQLDKSQTGVKSSADIMEVARKLVRDRSVSEEEAAKVVTAKIAAEVPKPKAWYRVQATRLISAGQRLVPRYSKDTEDLLERVKAQMEERPSPSGTNQISSFLELQRHKGKAIVEFAADAYAVLESEGHVRIGVKRHGDLSKEVKIGLETIDGTAEAEEDYKPIKQILTFESGQTSKDVYIDIVDDKVYEPDEFFFVKLFHHPYGSTEEDVVIGENSVNQVTIINDDEPGILTFSKPSYIVKESSGSAHLVIKRIHGADGEVTVTWRTQDMTAAAGHEFAGGSGSVTFQHGETSKQLSIDIYGIRENHHEPSFKVELSDPTGGAQVGKIPRTIVTIINDEEFNSMISRIANKTQKNLDDLRLDANSWTMQFRSAMSVNGGHLEDATLKDYVLHFISFFWKVLVAFIPPPSCWGGWLTFWLSLAVTGLLIAIINDLASIFGCLMGLSDYITAITFVAMGTSMPDIFSSRSAAINEKWADSSIGNITGSNSVNVFLGLGLPWLLGAIYWRMKGAEFNYPTETISLSVSVFTVCAAFVIIMLVCRRKMKIFGRAELGGPTVQKYASAGVVFLLWVLYVVVSSLQAQGAIESHI